MYKGNAIQLTSAGRNHCESKFSSPTAADKDGSACLFYRGQCFVGDPGAPGIFVPDDLQQ